MNEQLGHHIAGKFDEELKTIFEKTEQMAEEIDVRLELSRRAIVEGDSTATTKLLNSDAEINNLELGVAELCTSVFAKRCPNSSDLRFLVGVLHIIRDMERIGDLAQGIGHAAQSIHEEQHVNKNRDTLRHMIELTQEMLVEVKTSFSDFDPVTAFYVIAQDAAINKELESVSRLLVTYMMEDSRTIRSNLQIIEAAQSYERIGDHIKNIAEAIIYIAKGEDIRYRNVDGLESIIDD